MDILRGLAIISVVFGHLIPAPWGCYPFLFHMPLFFMLSGFFYRPNSDLRLFARQKGWTLLVPYGIYLFMIQFGLFFEYGRRLWECTGSAQVFVILSNFVNQLGDLADDATALTDQRQVAPKAGEKFHAVVPIDKGEPGDFLHVRQARLQHFESLVAGEDFYFMAELGERPRDGEHAR